MPCSRWHHTLILKIILLITSELANAWKGYICKINIIHYRNNQIPDDLFTLHIDFSKPHFLVLLHMALEIKKNRIWVKEPRLLCCKCTSSLFFPFIEGNVLLLLLLGEAVRTIHALVWDAFSNKMEGDKRTFFMGLACVPCLTGEKSIFLGEIAWFTLIGDDYTLI